MKLANLFVGLLVVLFASSCSAQTPEQIQKQEECLELKIDYDSAYSNSWGALQVTDALRIIADDDRAQAVSVAGLPNTWITLGDLERSEAGDARVAGIEDWGDALLFGGDGNRWKDEADELWYNQQDYAAAASKYNSAGTMFLLGIMSADKASDHFAEADPLYMGASDLYQQAIMEGPQQ